MPTPRRIPQNIPIHPDELRLLREIADLVETILARVCGPNSPIRKARPKQVGYLLRGGKMFLAHLRTALAALEELSQSPNHRSA